MTRGEAYLETPRGRLTRIGGWELGKTLGRGAYAHVRLATHTITGRQAACKILPSLHESPNMRYGCASDDEVMDAIEAHKELVLLKALNGAKIPGVVGLEGVLEEEGWNYIFLELHTGSLTTYNKGIPEHHFCSFFAELLRTMEALHEVGISHEDLKRSNILVRTEKDKQDHPRIHPIIVDFGFSHFTPSPNANNEYQVSSLGGTFDYSSPQKIAEIPYNPFLNDMWSLGIVLLKILRFPHPYLDHGDYHDDKKEAKMRIVLGEPVWSWKRSHCSAAGIANFAMDMMERDEKFRGTASQLLDHVYIKRRVDNMPPKVPIPPKRLSTKALRPVSDAVLQDLMFLAYQAGELCLCETDRNLKARLYAREACWEQRYANMLAKWEQKTDLEWEDMLPTNITTRSVKGLPRRARTIRPLKEIHLSPLVRYHPCLDLQKNPKSPRHKNVTRTDKSEELPHKAAGGYLAKAPMTPPSKILATRAVNVPAPIVAKRPKTRSRVREGTPLKQITASSSVSVASSATLTSNMVNPPDVLPAGPRRVPSISKAAKPTKPATKATKPAQTANTRTTRNTRKVAASSSTGGEHNL